MKINLDSKFDLYETVTIKAVGVGLKTTILGIIYLGKDRDVEYCVRVWSPGGSPLVMTITEGELEARDGDERRTDRRTPGGD